MKIITFAAIKGGVGKTTITLNYGDWLVKHGKKILLIDLDHQCNLTSFFEPVRRNNTIAEAFKDEDEAEPIKIDHINSKLDLIAGFIDLDLLSTKLENNSNKEMLLYMWIRKNYDKLNIDSYDYILIDTHPDFSTITKNAVAISNYLFSPLTPSKYGYDAKFDLEPRLEKFRKTMIDYKTGETYIDVELKFIANMVRHNTTTSHEFLKHIKDDKSVIAIIPERELFNKATTQNLTIFGLAKKDSTIKTKNNKFFQEIDNVFNKMEQQTR